jgi:hypothetical protein
MDAAGIKDVLRRMDAERIRGDGRNIWSQCPYAPWRHKSGRDHHPSCAVKVNPAGPSVFKCWSCEERGTFSDMVYHLDRLLGGMYHDLMLEVDDREEALLRAALEVGPLSARDEDDPAETTVATVRSTSITTPQERVLKEEDLTPFLGCVPQYILDRGFTLETCKAWGLGYRQDERNPRLIFPVRDWEQNLVGIVGGRIFDHQHPKYHNMVGFRAERYLYGECMLNPFDEAPLILVEGMLDVLWLWQHRIGRPVGCFGHRITPARVRKAQTFAGDRPVLTLFDGDEAGDIARDDAERYLGPYVPLIQHTPPRGKDPKRLPAEQLREIFKLSG